MYKKNTRYKILSNDGYVDFDGINTINKNQYIKIKTINHELKCSLNHRIYLHNGECVESYNINISDDIITPTGIEKIIYKEKIDEDIILYDPINVKNETNSYYSNNILSHNCDFLGSTNTVIAPNVLEYLFSLTEEPILLEMKGNFRIFEKPETGSIYVIGADVSKGTGGDYSVCQILKIKSLEPLMFEQVAVFQDNFTDVYSFSEIIYRISLYYNNAYIMVENNAEGAAVVNKLWWDIETENLVNTGSKEINLGIRATKRTKPIAVLLMKKLIEDECVKIRDKETIEQLASFIEQNDKFFGKDLHDDLVCALYWAIYIIKMDIFDQKILLKTGIGKGNEKENETDEDIWGIMADVEPEEDFKWIDNNII